MTKKSKTILMIIIFILAAVFIKLTVNIEENFNTRSIVSLMNQYFILRDKHPEAAKRALTRLLEKDPKNLRALRELGYWYLRQGDTKSALNTFTLANRYYPKDEITLTELHKLQSLTTPVYFPVFSPAITKLISPIQPVQPVQPVISASVTTSHEATHKKLSKQYTGKISKKNTRIKITFLKNSKNQINKRDQLFNQYYDLKQKNPQQAWAQLQRILKKYPDDLDALKEAGYTALNNKENASAYIYFNHAYTLTKDPELAMQIAYILDEMGNARLAYDYFDLATHTNNQKQRIEAEMAKTNLTAAKIKALPDPYYMDIYYDPFYYSRFNMTVEPLVIKAGKIINQAHETKIYLSYQRTSDTRSNFGQLPEIFDDNVAITAVGIQTNPILNVPLTAFAELGKAFDIVYQDRSRLRTDFRGGLAFYKDWGERPTYTLKPILGHQIVGDFYSDMIYFTRYRDIIGSARLREGIRVFKYNTTMIDLYLKAFLVWDTSHQYYNNIIEWGPGIAITPCNRYNIVLHLETLQGHYIPVTSPSQNTYSSNYHNNLILLDVFFRL